MAMKKIIEAAKLNLQKVWGTMSTAESGMNQSRKRARRKPGTTGEGRYYRVVVRPKSGFVTFRNHDVGERGGLQRVAGKRSSGSWADQAWLISKDMAHVEGDRLVPDDPDAGKILDEFGPVRRVKGDVFQGHPKRDIPEKEKPTFAQRRARPENIRKAQRAPGKKTRKAA